MKRVQLFMKIEEEKKKLRLEYLAKRNQISLERKKEAESALFHSLQQETHHHHYVLSFASKYEELSLWQLNIHLSSFGQLILPKVEGLHLVPYLVKDIESDLILGAYGIYEPNPLTCLQIPIDAIDLILVPGIVFDANGARIGYGKGFYDRLLENIHLTPKIGIGFKEQLHEKTLPQEEFDRKVNQLKMF